MVGLGCNNFGMRIDEPASHAVVAAALDEGINLFDTADIYGEGHSEEFLGRALGKRRKDIVLGTKFGYSGDASKDNVARSVEVSLKRLGTDVIDLYTVHNPDPNTPIEDTLEAMDGLVRAGKVRYVGCSNFSAAQLAEAADSASASGRAPFVAAQNRLSLLRREAGGDIAVACRDRGVGLVPFFPLESGMLTGKYRRGDAPAAGHRLAKIEHLADEALTEENFTIVEALIDFVESCGHTLLELAVSWLAAKPEVVSVIAGATTPEQVAQNAAAAGWRLTVERVGRAVPDHPAHPTHPRISYWKPSTPAPFPPPPMPADGRSFSPAIASPITGEAFSRSASRWSRSPDSGR